PDLRPEMTARVDLLIAQRRGVLLVPLNAIFERNGLPVAHVVRPFGFETRQIRLGPTGETEAEVVAGLSAGDRVRLVDAPNANAAPPAETGGMGPLASPAGGLVPSGTAI